MITQGAMAVEMQQWRDGRKAAENATEALSEALMALGIEAEQVSHLRPVVAYSGRPYVHMGVMPADLVERMAEALRHDDAPLPEHPVKRPGRGSGTLARWGWGAVRAIGPAFPYLFKGARGVPGCSPACCRLSAVSAASCELPRGFQPREESHPGAEARSVVTGGAGHSSLAQAGRF
ncbi:hypothetical protein ACIP6I_20015 [Streptomyces anulatus]